ncbi:MAG: glutamate--tRNA ligase [Candidatus Omnitrophica bacterium CG11_big_fil_rev_8_21_14_0_20_45_26]|uniref:Glutamate--tRNA ligase n=1 Tax=Candidatus Abzuiibacterium crystallinum TaxID=1974748 RepID=A0A2H0LL27_9BACT|nr:MAG: glutamate--tRNA ligase [Candidatus Omnitrophica bacterium CG11_big_fil_rev_8_21_14_0_20_45_26]PIW63774.1 MAG: glutamate--tRNA ligase [Candidatus Omnitrophica bacterium CG12_big_fil_rev_8_21_14_0_65_45_16]
MTVRTRFAPSPTGFLHIGNVRTALFNYLYAKHHKGKFILRIEDTDPERSKQEYADAILYDLEKIGLQWDEGPVYQSKQPDVYLESLNQLRKQDKVYPCYCTPDELVARRKEALMMKRPPRYDNRCRHLTREEIQKKEQAGIRPTIRFKVDDTKPVLVDDLIRGQVSFDPQEIGDFVIMRSDPAGKHDFLPTFHLSVCVDDGRMGITHIVRGEDHLSNSPRHVLLFQALGFVVPQFAHLSLIHGPGGEPLSKRLTAIRIRDFVEQKGYLVEGLLNYLALLGWSPKDNREVMSLNEIIEAFDLRNATKHSAIFNEDKLNWINSEHLRALSEDVYQEKAIEFLKAKDRQAGILSAEPARLKKSLSLIKTDMTKFEDLIERLSFLPEPAFKTLPAEEKKMLTQPGAQKVLDSAAQAFNEISGEGEPLYQALIDHVKAASQQKGKALFMPIRVAVTGHLHGPEMKKIFEVLDRATIQNRLTQMSQALKS